MEGAITALVANTSITVNVDFVGGSGTFAAWTFGWPTSLTSGIAALGSNVTMTAAGTAYSGPAVTLTVNGTYLVNTNVTINSPNATSAYMNATVIFKCGATVMSSGEQTTRVDGTNVGSVAIHLTGVCTVTGSSTAVTTTAYSTLAASVIIITTPYPTGSLGTSASAIQYVRIE